MQLPKRKLFTMSCMLFLGSLTVAAHELINTSSGVDELALTSIERVRGAGDFYFYHRVSFAFEFYCVVSLFLLLPQGKFRLRILLCR